MNRSRQSYRARDICAVRGTLSTIWEHLRRVCFESDCATLHWFRWITSLDEKLVKTRDSGEEKVCCCCHAAAAGDDTICEAHLHLFFVMPSSSISFSFELSMLASIACLPAPAARELDDNRYLRRNQLFVYCSY